MTTLPDVQGLRRHPPAVWRELLAIAARRGLDVDHLAAVIAQESGWNPQAENPYSHAVGLIQWMPQFAPVFGTTTDALKRMSALEQLAYVEKYFARFRQLAPRDIAIAVFLPARIGRPDSEIAFEAGSVGYRQNAGLDTDHDGRITLGEVRDATDRKLAGVGRFDVDVDTSSRSSSGWGWVVALAGVGLLARRRAGA